MKRISLLSRIVAIGVLLMAASWMAAPAVRAQDSNHPGTLSFYSTPAGAEVYLDNMRLGVTPLLLWSTAPGTHTIRFTKPGFYPVTRTLLVKSGHTYKPTVTLRHLPRR